MTDLSLEEGELHDLFSFFQTKPNPEVEASKSVVESILNNDKSNPKPEQNNTQELTGEQLSIFDGSLVPSETATQSIDNETNTNIAQTQTETATPKQLQTQSQFEKLLQEPTITLTIDDTASVSSAKQDEQDVLDLDALSHLPSFDGSNSISESNDNNELKKLDANNEASNDVIEQSKITVNELVAVSIHDALQGIDNISALENVELESSTENSDDEADLDPTVVSASLDMQTQNDDDLKPEEEETHTKQQNEQELEQRNIEKLRRIAEQARKNIIKNRLQKMHHTLKKPKANVKRFGRTSEPLMSDEKQPEIESVSKQDRAKSHQPNVLHNEHLNNEKVNNPNNIPAAESVKCNISEFPTNAHNEQHHEHPSSPCRNGHVSKTNENSRRTAALSMNTTRKVAVEVARRIKSTKTQAKTNGKTKATKPQSKTTDLSSRSKSLNHVNKKTNNISKQTTKQIDAKRRQTDPLNYNYGTKDIKMEWVDVKYIFDTFGEAFLKATKNHSPDDIIEWDYFLGETTKHVKIKIRLNNSKIAKTKLKKFFTFADSVYGNNDGKITVSEIFETCCNLITKFSELNDMKQGKTNKLSIEKIRALQVDNTNWWPWWLKKMQFLIRKAKKDLRREPYLMMKSMDSKLLSTMVIVAVKQEKKIQKKEIQVKKTNHTSLQLQNAVASESESVSSINTVDIDAIDQKIVENSRQSVSSFMKIKKHNAPYRIETFTTPKNEHGGNVRRSSQLGTVFARTPRWKHNLHYEKSSSLISIVPSKIHSISSLQHNNFGKTTKLHKGNQIEYPTGANDGFYTYGIPGPGYYYNLEKESNSWLKNKYSVTKIGFDRQHHKFQADLKNIVQRAKCL